MLIAIHEIWLELFLKAIGKSAVWATDRSSPGCATEKAARARLGTILRDHNCAAANQPKGRTKKILHESTNGPQSPITDDEISIGHGLSKSNGLRWRSATAYPRRRSCSESPHLFPHRRSCKSKHERPFQRNLSPCSHTSASPVRTGRSAVFPYRRVLRLTQLRRRLLFVYANPVVRPDPPLRGRADCSALRRGRGSLHIRQIQLWLRIGILFLHHDSRLSLDR